MSCTFQTAPHQQLYGGVERRVLLRQDSSSPFHSRPSSNFQFSIIIRSSLTILYRSIVNEAAAASPKQPIVNMGQGFFGYNPPEFIINAAKAALDKVDCNQYSPTKGRPRLKKAIADSYSPLWGRKLDPETEVTITTGANEG